MYLWKVILSDGVIDDYESGLIRNLTGLFHLTGKEVAETKATAEELIKCSEMSIKAGAKIREIIKQTK